MLIAADRGSESLREALFFCVKSHLESVGSGGDRISLCCAAGNEIALVFIEFANVMITDWWDCCPF